ncbi:hypothetical protein ACN94_06730 [Gordonia paraffinivorans]|uniref:hypothetical protein n=1 Tax=Gordonia paraffinivorans TaxID=175628 RepID=UPI000D61BCE8|nr:hypothetical protein [Gordonia paraffinivorans]MBY4573283.1 hypothetical protein [Gordonia paraffinivorans]PWD41260.1 hypothetical protein ACN93_20740 [Gordonia paraffinivorans]
MPVTVTERSLDFAFPELHPDARLRINVMRTLRVPDDNTSYGLPPGLGMFELRTANDVARPGTWAPTDALLPMWQAEAAWFSFYTPSDFPFLVRISVGGINAVTGEDFAEAIDFFGEDYFEVPEQPWLDGFRVDAKTVRQFVAMPLGRGYTAAEQLTGADDGTIRIEVTPLRASVWEERVAARSHAILAGAPMAEMPDGIVFDDAADATTGIGLGAGGTITQSIATPLEPRDSWELDATARATLRIINSADWESLTGARPHHAPPTITEYRQHGYPWFEWYDDSLARQGDSKLSNLRSVQVIGMEKGETPLPDNPSFTPPQPIVVGP